MIQTIKKYAIQSILVSLSGIVGLLIGAIYSESIPIFLPIIIQQLPNTLLLKLLLMESLLLLLIFVIALIQYLKLKNKPILKFGIYWDKKKEPYCPVCSKPLSYGLFYIQSQEVDAYVFKCINCNKFISCTNNGENINLEEAQKLL